jgi:hypothetical protein
MKILSDAIFDLFNDNLPALPWLDYVMGVGFRESGQGDAFGYIAGPFGLQLAQARNPPSLPTWRREDGTFEFAVGDTDQTAVYVCHEGPIEYGGDQFSGTAEVIVPLSAFLACPIDKIQAYGPALAFIIKSWQHSVGGVSLKLARTEALLAATNKKSGNTALGVAQVAFSAKLVTGKDCLVVAPCQ